MPPGPNTDLLAGLFAGEVRIHAPPKAAPSHSATTPPRDALRDTTNGAPLPAAPKPTRPHGLQGYALADASAEALAWRTQATHTTRHFARAVVTFVWERTAPLPSGRTAPQKVLELEVVSGVAPPRGVRCPSLYYEPTVDAGGVMGVAVLCDEWLTTPVQPGDVVHLVGRWQTLPYESPRPHPRPPASSRAASPTSAASDDDLWDGLDAHVFDGIDDVGVPTLVLASFGAAAAPETQHLLILHPDVIVSASALASVASCMRRPMLQERVKAPSDTTYAAVLGNMVHGLLQACLVAPRSNAWPRLGDFSQAFLDAEIARQLARHRGALSLVGVATATAHAALTEAVPSLVSFAERYLASVRGPPVPPHPVDDRRKEHAVCVQITRVLGAEDDVVAPMYGLKGRVDVCVEVHVHERGTERIALVPLEIKTGRQVTSVEHAAQTSLYTLLLADRYGVPVEEGLLLYTQSSALARVHRAQREVRSLLLARNEMAAYKRPLPASPDDSLLALAAPAARDTAALFPAPARLPPTIDHPFQCSRCYARDACMLYRAAVENVCDTDSPIAALYEAHTAFLSAAERAFFQHWDALLAHEEQTLARFRNELWTLPAAEREALGRCVTTLRLDATLDPACVALHAPSEHAALHAAFAEDDLVLLSAHRPHPALLGRARVTRVAAGWVEVRVEGAWREAVRQVQETTGAAPHTFRLDVDELTSMLSVPRYNVACLLYPDAPERVARLRTRVVHLAPPTFGTLDARTRGCLAAHTHTCNADQVRAIERALAAHDYALVLGMPGTGKSTMLATLIHILAACGQRVLLCSYTHSAVDTVLAKLSGKLDVLRLGAPSRVHPSAQAYTLEARLAHVADRAADVEALDTLATRAQVVAATCLATNDPVLQKRAFDVCIVDEASQITLPTCLGPLRYADRFVMVGDHHQLAPLVRARPAAEHGLQTSLFERLCTAHPAACTALTRQYRMHAAIMALSNALVYDAALQCGSAQVASATLSLRATPNTPWIAEALAPNVPVALLDTDAACATERHTHGAVDNPAEAALVGRLCAAARAAGLAHTDVGILTPYRQQVRLLHAVCDGEVLTVDQAQGRDWPLVLVSMVRANAANATGSLLRDLRRLNVLLTRAKHKLLLVGSARTLQGAAHDAQRPLARVVAQLHAMHAVQRIPPDAAPATPATPAHTTKTSPSKSRAVKAARRTGVAHEVLLEHNL